MLKSNANSVQALCKPLVHASSVPWEFGEGFFEACAIKRLSDYAHARSGTRDQLRFFLDLAWIEKSHDV